MSDTTEIVCSLLWKLSRSHGWSERVSLWEVVRQAGTTDESDVRRVGRTELAGKDYVGYRQDTDEIWLHGPPHDAIAEDLIECGYRT